MDLDQFDKALQAPTMEAVIALTERFQDLESKPEAMVFSFLRNIDQTIAVGYSDDFSTTRSSFEQRDFVLIDATSPPHAQGNWPEQHLQQKLF